MNEFASAALDAGRGNDTNEDHKRGGLTGGVHTCPGSAETMGDASTATEHVVCRDDGACHYRPNRGAIQSPNVLGALVGQAANGDWTLCAGDRAGSDTGRFEAWALVLDYEPPVATMRLPIVVRNATELMFRDGFETP